LPDFGRFLLKLGSLLLRQRRGSIFVELGTISGMNFEFMPELRWDYGYVLALVLMAISAVLPYHWFKWRGWL
jgi:hypothetical protein